MAVCNHQLFCVQPNYSGKRNTAKGCTEYRRNICSVCTTAPWLTLKGEGYSISKMAVFMGFIGFLGMIGLS